MEFVLVGAMIVGATEFVKRLFDRDFRAAMIILVATGVGALCGVFGVEDISIAEGIVLGLGAAGAVTTATRIG